MPKFCRRLNSISIIVIFFIFIVAGMEVLAECPKNLRNRVVKHDNEGISKHQYANSLIYGEQKKDNNPPDYNKAREIYREAAQDFLQGYDLLRNQRDCEEEKNYILSHLTDIFMDTEEIVQSCEYCREWHNVLLRQFSDDFGDQCSTLFCKLWHVLGDSEAGKFLDWAQPILEQPEYRANALYQARLKWGLATKAAQIGTYKNALDLAREATQLYGKLNDEKRGIDKEWETQAWLFQATLMERLGKLSDSLNAAQEAERLAEKYKQPIQLKEAKRQAGFIFYKSNKFSEALKIFSTLDQTSSTKATRSLQLDQNIPIDIFDKYCLGLVYSAMGDETNAQKYFEMAWDINEKKGNAHGVFFQQQSKGIELLRKAERGDELSENDLQSASQALKRCLENAEKVMDRYNVARIKENLAIAERLLGSRNKQEGNLRAADAQFQKSRDLIQSSYLSYKQMEIPDNTATIEWAILATQEEKYEEARERFKEAETLLQKEEKFLVPAYGLHGEMEIKNGNYEQGIEKLKESLRIADQLRGQQPNAQDRASLQNNSNRFSCALVAAQWKRDDTHGLLQAIEESRARSLLDMMQNKPQEDLKPLLSSWTSAQKQSQSAVQPSEKKPNLPTPAMGFRGTDTNLVGNSEEDDKIPLDSGAADVPNARELVNLLPEGVAAVEYFHCGESELRKLGSDQLLITLVIKDQTPAVFTASVTKRELAENVAKYVDAVTMEVKPEYSLEVKKENAEALKKEAQQLHQKLIAPFWAALPASIHTIVLIPCQETYLLPWASLFDGKQYLPQTGKALVIAPSLAGIKKLRDTGLVNASLPESIYVMADPTENLKGTLQEVQNIVSLFPTKQIYIKGEASKKQLINDFKLGPPAEVLHFACHGYFLKNTPMKSFIQLSDDGLRASEMVRLNWYSGKPVKLVALSACVTGKATIGKGEESMGIVRGLLGTGRIPAALLSLWDVSDAGNVELMKCFYENWLGKKEGLQLQVTKAQALRKAQQEMIENEQWICPYFWAPMQLYGGWW